MLKNDTLKNSTSRIGLYGSAPPPPGRTLPSYEAIALPFDSFCITDLSADHLPKLFLQIVKYMQSVSAQLHDPCILHVGFNFVFW